jgi:subtilisin family serine protease
MRELTSIIVMAAGLVAALPCAVHAGNCPDTNGISPLIADQAMVRTLPEVALADFIVAFETSNPGVTLTEVDALPARSTHLLAVDAPPGTDIPLLVTDLEDNYLLTHLAWGEFLYENQAPEGHTGSIFVDEVPDGGLFGGQYAGGMLDLSGAHTRTTGGGIVVAVLDTGVDPLHAHLQPRNVAGGVNLVDDNTDTADVGDGQDNDGDGQIDELTGHGTFVAGLITLAAPEAWILPVRVLDSDGIGNTWILTKGLYHAIDRGVEVINLSLGSTYNSSGVNDAIEEAKLLGIPVVAAAGNLNRDCPEEYPAMTNNAFGVAATDDVDRKADFSNFNDKLLVSAPGDTAFIVANPSEPDPLRSIVSTVPGGGFAVWEGTSMAAPLVSGALALVRAQHPEWRANEITHLFQETLVVDHAVSIAPQNPGFDELLGAGRLHAGAMALAGPVAPALGDLNADGAVDIDDLVRVILDWGLVHSSADLDGDGFVGVDDLVVVVLGWTG